MPGEKIVKSVFHTLNALHGQGFSIWVTIAYDLAQVCDIDMNASVALTAKQFKSLLVYINVPKFSISLSKISASSHDLEMERGRYTRTKTDPKQRLCAWCLEVEDEEHFITRCQITAHERQILYSKVGPMHPAFQNISNHDQFIFPMSCKGRQMKTWLGKFLHKSFDIRNYKRYKSCIPSQ